MQKFKSCFYFATKTVITILLTCLQFMSVSSPIFFVYLVLAASVIAAAGNNNSILVNEPVYYFQEANPSRLKIFGDRTWALLNQNQTLDQTGPYSSTIEHVPNKLRKLNTHQTHSDVCLHTSHNNGKIRLDYFMQFIWIIAHCRLVVTRADKNRLKFEPVLVGTG